MQAKAQSVDAFYKSVGFFYTYHGWNVMKAIVILAGRR